MSTPFRSESGVIHYLASRNGGLRGIDYARDDGLGVRDAYKLADQQHLHAFCALVSRKVDRQTLEIVAAYVVGRLSFATLAHRVGCSETTVRRRIMKARHTIRDAAIDHGLVPESQRGAWVPPVGEAA